MKRVTADTNILLSALLWGGKPLQLVELARAGKIELAVSGAVLDEVCRVLAEKFHRPAEDVAAIREEIESFARVVIPTERVTAVVDDASDDKILECAVAGRSEAVVSGDKHILSLGSFRGIQMMTVTDFLARLQGRGRGA